MKNVSSTLAQRKQEIVERHGPWRFYNIRLGESLYTIEPGLVGPSEMRVHRISQLVSDLVGERLGDVRILDLGAHEGGFAVDLAHRGAEVVAVDARDAHVAKAQFAKDALGLSRLSVRYGDVRELDPEALGSFDVVLCLGLLYHLEAQDMVQLLQRIASLGPRFTVIETMVSLLPKTSVELGGRRTFGRYFSDPAKLNRGSESDPTFWPTKSSLLNLLQAVGFSSVTQCLNPVVSDLAAFADSVTLVATKGTPLEPRSVPELEALPADAWEWPERPGRLATPTQGIRYAARELLNRRRGRGMERVFGKRRLETEPSACSSL